MPRNRITEKGKLKQNRGRGHGEDYQGWIRGGDFPSPSGFSRPSPSAFPRALDLFPPHEPILAYELLWRMHTKKDVTDIREQFPLPPAETLEICKRRGILPPQSEKEYKLITIDLLADVITTSGRSWYEAYDVVTAQTLETDWREVEMLEVRRTFFTEREIPYFVRTEHQLNKPLADNVKLILRGYDLRDYPELTEDDLRQAEPDLFDHLHAATVPFRYVAREWDQRLGLGAGSTLTMIWYFLWHQIWRVDMNLPIEPRKSALQSLERIGWNI